MPFVNRAQAGVCYGKARMARAKNQPVAWDCDEAMRAMTDDEFSQLGHRGGGSARKKKRKTKPGVRRQSACLMSNLKADLVRKANALGLDASGTKQDICERLVAAGMYDIDTKTPKKRVCTSKTKCIDNDTTKRKRARSRSRGRR